MLGNFLKLPMLTDFFDCTVSLHTIYHIDKMEQEAAVRKLIRVTKPGRPVIIVYRNPAPLFTRLAQPFRTVKNKARQIAGFNLKKKKYSGLYVYSYHIRWWQRFADQAEVKLLPWRSFSSRDQKLLFPNNVLGKWMLASLFALEDKFPRFFVNHAQYPMIVLTKRAPPLASARPEGRLPPPGDTRGSGTGQRRV